jgi:hypothetical protein
MASQQITDFLSAGDFYSAHQKARTTAIRLLAPPRRNPPPKGAQLPYDSKAQEAAELLWDSARKLLEQGQQGSGVDLGVMLVEDVWTARGNGCGKDERGTSTLSLLLFLRTRRAEAGSLTGTNNVAPFLLVFQPRSSSFSPSLVLRAHGARLSPTLSSRTLSPLSSIPCLN